MQQPNWQKKIILITKNYKSETRGNSQRWSPHCPSFILISKFNSYSAVNTEEERSSMLSSSFSHSFILFRTWCCNKEENKQIKLYKRTINIYAHEGILCFEIKKIPKSNENWDYFIIFFINFIVLIPFWWLSKIA